MSIPLDRLYHYIDNIAQDVYGDTIIYRFYPYGSKKIEDLTPIRYHSDRDIRMTPQIICNDQEPLNFNLYQTTSNRPCNVPESLDNLYKSNLRKTLGNVFDKAVILHSEKNSQEVQKYQNNYFIPVYYWNHALIAQDWFRYAKHVDHSRVLNSKKLFLIYNRAWKGTREYRLKFAEQVALNNLVDCCHTSVAFFENDVYYRDYNFLTSCWKPSIILEDYFSNNVTTSCFSADFNLDDYKNTNIEVVLETLFNDQRIHLTEKILRPIALGHPFLLCSTAGSLQYLRDYGFQTFNGIIDESYDQIIDPIQRLDKIISVMKEIKNWMPDKRQKNIQKMKAIAKYNKERFFSDDFFNLINKELIDNLTQGIQELLHTNTFNRIIKFTHELNSHKEYLDYKKTLPDEAVNLREEILKAILAIQKTNK